MSRVGNATTKHGIVHLDALIRFLLIEVNCTAPTAPSKALRHPVESGKRYGELAAGGALQPIDPTHVAEANPYS